ncbi:MAG: Adenylate cyclase 2 [Candidatus Aerophobetes bacterium ADurb.Bin490]|nr:MAG: Adenylate cyclase 2 [Candidatus Aerophobetes bacterium ADurb.Bin490]HNZ28364.1 adenylate/guanylate cyclase domain-containing protein [Candidatus Goldiibacteriota bacterium]HPI02866.1 adenylate/guanylate cyclase domain-containing protein [Candidatus Goldiibacteriota bacterium]HRQ43954.1 adenylate/guanylate cyclase domain-containing protein [Candidatus Goldiibacteriota bacterium]
MAEKKAGKKRKNKGIKISLGTKFSFLVGLLFAGIMAFITVFIYNHESEVLSNQIKQRGTAIAVNLANNASEALTNDDELTLSKLAKEAVQETKFNDNEMELYDRIIKILKEDIIEQKKKEIVKNEGILEAVVVKKDGSIASANEVRRIDERYILPAGLKPVQKENDVLIQEYNTNGKSYFDIAVPLIAKLGAESHMIGEVHLTVSRQIITESVAVAAVKVALITVVGLIAGILFTVVLVGFMVKPIKQLVKGVNKIGEGNYDVVIASKSHDEIGDLTKAFNATAKSLKEKELLKGAFSTYVSDKVMQEVLKDPNKLKIHGTKVRATMLFTDIRGFTSMSENLQPEEVVSVINEYLTLQTDKVFKWEGLLDKFVGDCVMAVYGVPFPKSDDSYRAVRTAMDIREGVERMNVIRKKRNMICVQIGIGVNTGDVVSGNMGSPQKMDYTVIGDNVNLAARLEANAPGGQIYVSESTYTETKDYIEYEELPSIMVKGKKEPIKIYSPKLVKMEFPKELLQKDNNGA